MTEENRLFPAAWVLKMKWGHTGSSVVMTLRPGLTLLP